MGNLNNIRLVANLAAGLGMGGRAIAFVLYFAARSFFVPFAVLGAALLWFCAGLYAGSLYGARSKQNNS